MGEYDRLLSKLEGLARGIHVSGGMTSPPSRRILLDSLRFSESNAGIPGSHPELLEAHYYLVSQSSTWLFGRVYPGVYTSGGTEGNILALLAAREDGRRRVLYPETAHYSIVKAARLLGMEAVEIPVGERLDPSVEAVEEHAGPDAVLVLTHGTTETGHVDNVPLLARTACGKGAIVHLDAAYSGPFARFFAPAKTPSGLDGCVRTITLDIHKLPPAPAPAGLLLVYDRGLVEKLTWSPGYLPSPQPGLLGTRPGWSLVAAALTLAWVNDTGGPAWFARRAMENTWTLYRLLVEEGPFDAVHPPETPLFCITHPRVSEILEEAGRHGYRLYTCPRFGGIRVTVAQPPDQVLLETLLRAGRYA